MTKNEFLTEVLNSEFNDGTFEESYKEFQKYQDAAIKTLKEFHRVCEKNSIPYQLAFGSLLGAVRDNGQIPWDYDVDVLVPYPEKEKLINALKSDLSDDYYFVCPEVDKKYIRYMIRIAPKGYDTEALHVDVFYSLGAPDDPAKRDEMSKCVKNIYRARKDKMRNIFKESGLTFIRFLYRLKLKLTQIGYSTKQMNKDKEELCTKYDFYSSKYCMSFEGIYAISYEREKLWDTFIMDTEIGSFRVTKDYEGILTQIYKDYKKIFPLKNRYNEMMMYLKAFRYFKQK